MKASKTVLAWIIQDRDTNELETVFSPTVSQLQYRVDLWQRTIGKRYRIIKRAIPLQSIKKKDLHQLINQ